jgi:hypothetical protein
MVKGYCLPGKRLLSIIDKNRHEIPNDEKAWDCGKLLLKQRGLSLPSMLEGLGRGS